MIRLIRSLLIVLLYLRLQPTQAQDEDEDEEDFSFRVLRLQHTPKALSVEEIKYLAKLSNMNYTEEILDKILKPREMGTTEHEEVFKYISNNLKEHDWHIETDEFKDDYASGNTYTFKNIVGSLNPHAERYLVVACHYDTKMRRSGVNVRKFLGAIDAAVPCAMMLNLIEVMKDHLARIRDRTDLSLKLIFFDGEEAYWTFSKTDGTYGSRHLAQKYSENRAVFEPTNETITDLDKIDLLVLLDLLGASEPTFYSYFHETDRWYLRLLYAEECLNDLKQLKESAKRNQKRYFLPRYFYTNSTNDYVPFKDRGVPILYLVPDPFPPQWHQLIDDREHLDPVTTEDLNKILRVFVTEYLHLPVNVITD